MPAPQRSKKGGSTSAGLFTDEERAAMREAVRERRARPRNDPSEGARDVAAKIAEMRGTDRRLAQKVDTIIRANAPGLVPRTWYGMPAYGRDGQVLCFFRSAAKFKTRYATLGFSDEAKLDDGPMWPTDFALTEITPTEEARIAALVRRAVR